MDPYSCSLESFLFEPYSMEDILLDDNSDQDRQFYNDGDNFYDTSYFSQNELTTEQKKCLFYISF